METCGRDLVGIAIADYSVYFQGRRTNPYVERLTKYIDSVAK